MNKLRGWICRFPWRGGKRHVVAGVGEDEGRVVGYEVRWKGVLWVDFEF